MLPTDGEIMDVLVVRSGGINPTYYIKNCLRRKFPSVKTPWLLRRLKAMEKAGKVRRVPSDYATMICWDVAAAKVLTRCAAGRDGECGHAQCPQLRDGEPAKSGRHCPLDNEGSE